MKSVVEWVNWVYSASTAQIAQARVLKDTYMRVPEVTLKTHLT